jgi:hypothetical protein
MVKFVLMSIENFYERNEPVRRQLESACTVLNISEEIINVIENPSPFVPLESGHEVRVKWYRIRPPKEIIDVYALEVKVAEDRKGNGIGRKYAWVEDIAEPRIHYDDERSLEVPLPYNATRDSEVVAAINTIQQTLLAAQTVTNVAEAGNGTAPE